MQRPKWKVIAIGASFEIKIRNGSAWLDICWIPSIACASMSSYVMFSSIFPVALRSLAVSNLSNVAARSSIEDCQLAN